MDGDLIGTRWVGTHELWLDPLGHESSGGGCTLEPVADGVRWTWEHEGATNAGSLLADGDGYVFVDSWHSPDPMRCAPITPTNALLEAHGTYEAPEGPAWGWRTTLSLRPGGTQLVLQMENTTGWGEHGRAVRMTCDRAEPS